MTNYLLTNFFIITFLISPVVLIIGLIKPAFFKRFSNNGIPRRKTIGLVCSGVFFISMIGIGTFAPPAEIKNNTDDIASNLKESDKNTPSKTIPAQDNQQFSEKNEAFEAQTTADSELEKDNRVTNQLTPEVSSTTSEKDQNDELVKGSERLELPSASTNTPQTQPNQSTKPTAPLLAVTNVVDGDTFKVNINGKTESIRLIGINTPETVDPRKPVECFGVEASNKAKSLLSGKKVVLESDNSQGERDKYGRLLRYAFLEDGTNFNLLMIKEGYAYEYTYDLPYKYQSEFKAAQKAAMESKIGLWGNICQSGTAAQQLSAPSAPDQSTGSSGACTIKGNINSSGDKIYHVIGCQSYDKTIIDESAGERWFCTEQEALDAGWRKAQNCN